MGFPCSGDLALKRWGGGGVGVGGYYSRKTLLKLLNRANAVLHFTNSSGT